MSFSGKKFKKVDYNNIIELIDALNLDEKIRSVLRIKESVNSFTKNDDGTWTYTIEAADKVLLNETFTLDKEHDYKRPDGVVNIAKFWLEGNTMKQTLANKEGKTVYFDRAFDGDKMTMTVRVDGVDTVGTVNYVAV